jgi:hypothetical protein
MKKIFALAALLATLVCATAQITPKDLQGKWKLVTYDDGSATIDAGKGTFELQDDYKQGLTESELKEDEHNYAILARQTKTATLEFKGDKVTQVFGTDVFNGTFEVENGEGVSGLVLNTDDGQETLAEIVIKGRLLYMDSYEDGLLLVYKKM